MHKTLDCEVWFLRKCYQTVQEGKEGSEKNTCGKVYDGMWRRKTNNKIQHQ